jgi:hypothetical protein
LTSPAATPPVVDVQVVEGIHQRIVLDDGVDQLDACFLRREALEEPLWMVSTSDDEYDGSEKCKAPINHIQRDPCRGHG